MRAKKSSLLKISRFFSLFFLGILFLSPLSLRAQGLSPEQRALMNSGVRYFNIKEGCVTNGKQSSGGTASNNIYVIGDSLTVGMRDSGGLGGKLEGVGWKVQNIEATSGDTVAKALPKMASDQSTGVVVVALGTNKDSDFGARLGEMMSKIKTQSPAAQVYWMNAYTKAANYDDINASINNQSGALGYKVMDWQKEYTSNSRNYVFAGDNIHLSAQGYSNKADWLVNQVGTPIESAVTTGTATSQLQGADNREKAWFFFSGKGLTPEQASGIMGNLMVESGLNPFNEENGFEGQDKGGKGIAQWTATRRIDFEGKAREAGVITREAAFAAVPEAEKPATNDKALLFNLNYLWEEAIQRGDIDKLKAETVGEDSPKKIEAAVISWERWYERAGKPALGARYDKAIEAFNDFSGKTASAAPATANAGCLGDAKSTGTSFAGGSKVAELALSQVGIQEGSADCNKYFRGAGTCSSIQWCAAFTRWVYDEAGFPVEGGNRAKGVGKWFSDNKAFFSWKDPYKPEVGDIYVKGRNGSGTGWEGDGHIGIVVSVNGFTMETVEGNSSNQVKKNTYADYRSIPDLIGFGRYVDQGSLQQTPGFDPTQGAGGAYDSNDEN